MGWKKEIWKLLELLNEYVEEMWMCLRWHGIEWEVFVWEHWTDLSEMVMISKNYWFIQRLVEQDKIDKDKIIEKSEYLIEYRWNNIDQNMFRNTLLMLLSISENPISDLISYLKIDEHL